MASTTNYDLVPVGIDELRRAWRWFLALGVAFIILGLGCIALEGIATFATVLFFGCLLMISGVLQLVQAFRTGTWSGFLLYLFGALLRGFTGYLLIRFPVLGAESLTLLLSLFLMVSGVFRAVGSAMMKFPNWGWFVLSGLVTTILGIVLIAQMPISGLWFIGFAIGVDLIFEGVAIIGFGNTIHHMPKISPSAAS